MVSRLGSAQSPQAPAGRSSGDLKSEAAVVAAEAGGVRGGGRGGVGTTTAAVLGACGVFFLAVILGRVLKHGDGVRHWQLGNGEPLTAWPFCAAARLTAQPSGLLAFRIQNFSNWAERACKRLDPRNGVYDRWEPGVAAWWGESGASFLRRSFIIGILVIPGARYGLDFLFMRLGQRTLAPIMGRVPDPEDMTLVKWREACWKMLTYTGLAVFGAFVVNGEPWVADTQRLWLGWPAQQHSRSLVFWYCAEFGLYGYGLVDLLVWEAMRNDYFAMIIHHVSTLSLLFGSYYFGFLRIGALIMIMNDFVDLFFEGAKIANYAELKDTSTGFYMAFVVTWFVLRQVYCPLWILWTSYQEAWVLVEKFGPTTFNVATWIGFNFLLSVLQIQHTYWFVFIVKKVKVTFTISVIGRRDTDLTED